MKNIENIRLLHKAMVKPLKDAGFVKRSNSYYRKTEDTVLIVNIQKFEFGEEFFINLAICLKELNREEWPKYYQCPLRIRADRVVTQRERLTDVLNFSLTDILDEDRCVYIENVIRNEILPFLFRFQTREDVKRTLLEERWENFMVMLVAYDYLGIPRNGQ